MKGKITELAALLFVDADKVIASTVNCGPAGSNRMTVYQAILEVTSVLSDIEKVATAHPDAFIQEATQEYHIRKMILLHEIELLQHFGAGADRSDYNAENKLPASKPPPQKAACDHKVTVGGLPPSVDSGNLKEYFGANVEPVEEAMVISTPDGHAAHSRGFKQEETAAKPVEKHFLSISKRVGIKSSDIKSGPVKLASSQTSLKQLFPKDLTYKKLEREIPEVKSGCDYHVAGRLTDKSLHPWVSEFQKWLPIFLEQKYKRLGPGEHYPLSSIKSDFRAACGYELDHASLGFLNLSEYIQSLTGICRMKTAPVGNDRATHVLLPLQSTAHPELFQFQCEQVEQQQLMQSRPTTKHNVDERPSGKSGMGWVGSGCSNPVARFVGKTVREVNAAGSSAELEPLSGGPENVERKVVLVCYKLPVEITVDANHNWVINLSADSFITQIREKFLAYRICLLSGFLSLSTEVPQSVHHQFANYLNKRNICPIYIKNRGLLLPLRDRVSLPQGGVRPYDDDHL